jgi:CRP-like cAMP-binding protein
MERGRLVQQGDHESLVREAGQYRDLWQKQSGFDVSHDGRQATVDGPRLRHVTLFTDLDDATLERIAGTLASEFFDAEQTVFSEGQPGDRFYLIARGQVKVTTVGPAGEDHVLDLLSDGDHFGELALIQDRPRTATIRTATPSVFLTMSRQDFLELVATTPEMSRMLEQRMTRSELNLDEWRRLLGQSAPS